MRVLPILANPDENSFNHAIAATAIRTLERMGHEVVFHDLCREGFDPILSSKEIPKDAAVDPIIERHCEDLAGADGIIVIHPNWWGQPPAILKGWIDRVIRPGTAYEFIEGDAGEGIPIGLLKAKQAIVFNTSNTAESRELKVFGDPLEAIWKKCIFEFCGVVGFYRKTYRIVVTSTPEQRQAWLRDADEIMTKYFPAAD